MIDRMADSGSPVIIIRATTARQPPGLGFPSDACWERADHERIYCGRNRFLYPSISPVNSFRVVLNTYFQAGLPLLPDDTYFTSHRLEREAIDITAIRTSQDNCSPQK
jgi:hypothetical protein